MNAPSSKESSAMSRSTSRQSISTRNDIIQGSATLLDKTFPLFDEILKNSHIPNFLYMIMLFLEVLQFFGVSFWPGFEYTRNYDDICGKIIKIFLQIAFLSDLKRDLSSYLMSFIICIILCFLLVIVVIIQFAFYAQNRRFIGWTLYATRFLLEFVPQIITLPMANFLGSMFVTIVEDNSLEVDIYFVFTLIFWAVIVFIFYLMCYFSSVSPYIASTPIACWSGSYMFIMFMSLSIFTILSYVFQIFARWIDILLVAARIAVSIYLILRATYLPFVRVSSNVLVTSIFVTCTALDIVTIVETAGITLNYYVHIAVLFGVMTISLIVVHFIQKKSWSKVYHSLAASCLEKIEIDTEKPDIQNLQANQINFLQDQARKQLLLSYGLDRNFRKLQYYIRVGIAQRSDLFLDWSLLKFGAEFYDSTEMYCLIVQILSYFPSESRLLNFFFSQAVSKVGLSLHERFLLYEVHRVMGLRQSSASSEITDKLIETKHLSIKGANAVRGFWKNVPNEPHVFLQVKQFTNQVSALFRESMEKWPNNVRLCEDFSKFLIECGMDFCEGVKMKHRADLIEQGKNFVVDLSFRSMVRVYPLYLKRGIVDVKGNFVINKQNRHSQSQSQSSLNNNSQLSTGTIDGELDIEIEEEVSKQLFSYHRLRLAFQRALENRTCIYSKLLKLSAIFTVVLVIAILIFLFIYFQSLFNSRQENMNRELVLNEIRYGLDISLTAIVIYWASGAGAFPTSLYKEMMIQSPISNDFNLRLFQNDTLKEVTRWCSYGREKLEEFLQQMIELAADGDDIRNYMQPMFKKLTSYHYCISDKPIMEPSLSSLKNSFTYIFLRLREITLSLDNIRPDASRWNESENLCEIFYNIESVVNSFAQLSHLIELNQQEKKEKTEKENYIILIICCVLYTVTTTPLLIIFTTKTYHELLFLLDLMKSVDDESKEEATKPFKDTPGTEEQDSASEQLTKAKVRPANLIANYLCILIIGNAIFIVDVILAQKENTNLLDLNVWLSEGAQRGNLILEILYRVTFVVSMAQGSLKTSMTSIPIAKEEATYSIQKLVEYNNALLRGSNITDGCSNYSKELDSIHYDSYCVVEPNMTKFHKTYECASLDTAITHFVTMSEAILRAPEEFTFERDSQFFHIFHIANNHILDQCHNAALLLFENSATALHNFKIELLIITIVGIVYAIVSLFIFWALVLKLDRAHDGALQLLRRIPPLACTSNPPVMNYLLHKKSAKVDDKMTASKSVIMNSHDAVICLHRNESIEVVNNSVSSLFGYTPEQLLGQPISCVLPQEEASVVFHHFNLMRAGQCALTFETTTIGKTDDDQNVPIHVTVLGISEDSSNTAASFVIIIRDETQLQKHRQEAEEAKAQSEHLLYQILPRDIVVRLNQGETDISFSVPSASIIFIDIIKWSDYSSTLSPQQIMSNLSVIFAKFDNACSRFNLIQKIKLIGDVYMAAAGLFTPHEPPVNHAQQTIQFGLDCLVALDEANAQLDSSLMVRIGINTDGPLIAGVLGTDKPVFDIIGDPINVASRLQSTCLPATVQISQKTYDLVADLSFNIEQRGEIELKGKGKKMAYLVRPMTTGSFFMQSEKDPNNMFSTTSD
ncbi:Adenylate and Guanylate cyclase catalytic domain containing protein [Tritrichomonas foetus]|uniref:Adenylate and Guanylate cyclase catalytic domain containing protein n=1 Tax=Tritrichomonas foetus TaxID=1144522 RepID=A0A1J4JB57_9EUKA|nr:Adenylate and Guanylate cyclase catalytic domain containing protein [Tritrichomonas foetus]|eukprot:OHS96426.1 Adenylate and Guanylate cyclase catalytic domain containing protein [Tritrichomonas foetus]